MDSDSSKWLKSTDDSTMPNLPQELITDILLRLSVKPLSRFKCVSKSWLALISSPNFAKTHLSIAADNEDCTYHRFVLTLKNLHQYRFKDCSVSSSLINDSVIEAVDLDFPIKGPLKHVLVLGSINGLICLHVGVGLFLWNPSIRKFKKLPPLELTRSNSTYLRYGFGYDVLHDDYKVVCLCCSLGRSDEAIRYLEVKIYSLKSDSWRRTSSFPSGTYFSCRRPTFVNGKLLWKSNAIGSRTSADKRAIISFDLIDEKWVKVEQPSYGGEGYYVSQPLGLGSDLSIVCVYPSTHADVWVMKEYGVKESWTKVYTIKYPIDPKPHLFSEISSILRISSGGEILLVSGRTFMIYNPDDESVKSFRYPDVTNVQELIMADIYIESLVCPLLQDEPEQVAANDLFTC